MLTITDAAWARLSELQSTRPDIKAVRLIHDKVRVKCHRGIQRAKDEVMEQNGSPLLLMSPTVARQLSGQTLDAPDTKHGPRLRLKPINPRQKKENYVV